MSESPNSDWNEDRLKGLIRDKIEESLSLEYKAAAALAREDKAKIQITKDVSAMANSAGGILIYGMAEFSGETQKHLPERIDPVNRNDFSKEWLENIITQIRPRIPDLKIFAVQLSSSPDEVVYVLEIPPGSTAHQANDCRYYRRFNFQSAPMVDHEVRDVMNRKTHPRVSVGAKIVFYPRQNQDGSHGALVVEIENQTDVLARYVALVIHSPIRIRGKVVNFENSTMDEGEEGYAYRLYFSNHLSAPLFPRGMLRQVFKFSFADRMNPEPQNQLKRFRWVVFADAMPMQSGAFEVEELITVVK